MFVLLPNQSTKAPKNGETTMLHMYTNEARKEAEVAFKPNLSSCRKELESAMKGR